MLSNTGGAIYACLKGMDILKQRARHGTSHSAVLRPHSRGRDGERGGRLLPRVRELLADAERLALGARVLATGRLSRITVAAPATTLAEVIAPFIATLGPGDPTPSAFASDGQDLKRHCALARIWLSPTAAQLT